MKTIRLTILISIVLSITSCDYLDYDERSYLLEDNVFNEYGRIKEYLTGIYAYMPTGFNAVDGAVRESATDDAVHVWKNSAIHMFNDGSLSAINSPDNTYSNMYKGIRAVNRLLFEIEGQTFEEQKYNLDYNDMMAAFELFPYQARFLRAYFYFELVKRYGSVPLIKTVIEPEVANSVSQVPFDTLIGFIVSECDSVAAKLPVVYSAIQGESGRATKGAAMALKSRALLYAASPLNNSANNVEKWQSAAEASHDLIYMNAYNLEQKYKDLCNNPLSVELIMGRSEEQSNSFEINNFPIGYEGGNTGTCPTQNLVDCYNMQETGLPISDPESGYDPNFPYLDRDPRLYETILTNGTTWKGKKIETFYEGANAKPKSNATLTGYYLKKYLIESINLDPTNTTKKEHTWVLFRYGEILLNYAEAMNEAYGPEDPASYSYSALEAVNLLRTRAEMPEFPSGLSQSELREKIYNERRVELAFEDHRFWDIRRWNIGGSTTDIYGVVINSNVFGGYTYQKALIEKRYWEDYMNLYPIPATEIYINENLSQNSGW